MYEQINGVSIRPNLDPLMINLIVTKLSPTLDIRMTR